jgi:hypothetical protein
MKPSDTTGSTQLVLQSAGSRHRAIQLGMCSRLGYGLLATLTLGLEAWLVNSLLCPTFSLICNVAVCICGFCMVATLNSHYLLKHHQPADLCNGEVWCFLWGTDWILKCYEDSVGFKGLVVILKEGKLENVGKKFRKQFRRYINRGFIHNHSVGLKKFCAFYGTLIHYYDLLPVAQLQC